MKETNQLFSSLTQEDLNKFWQCANPTVHKFKTGEIILNQGEDQNYLLLLLNGEVEIYKEDYEGDHSLVGVLHEGESYGEQVIFSEKSTSTFQLVAAAPTKLMYVHKSLFYRPCSKVCPTHQAIIRNMLSLLANQTNLLEKKITFLTAKGLRQKIALYLWDEYKKNGCKNTFNVTLNREEMAKYFDVQRPSLSRELRSLKAEGIIDYYRNTFKILNLEKLKENIK